MKAAFTEWEGRIAPVFDVARTLIVVEVEDGRITKKEEISLPRENPVQRALRLASGGIGVLVCGAVSRPVEAALLSCDIRVFSFVAGEVTDVIGSWMQGEALSDKYAMPGCRGHGRHRRGACQAPAAADRCVCPRCGHAAPHERGNPCSRSYCPVCGAPLRREIL